MEVPLLEGAYEARSVIAAAQRCVNLYPEINQRESFLMMPRQVTPSLTTHYPTPGLRKLAQGPAAEVRGLYRATNGNLYTVIGSNLYFVTPQWQLQYLATIPSTKGQVRMVDNGLIMVLTDGSPFGTQVNIFNNAVTGIDDPNFFGGKVPVFIASFFVFDDPEGKFFYTSPSNSLTPFDPTYQAAKDSYADPLRGIGVSDRQCWIFGSLTTEIWYLNGGATFPFAVQPSTLIPWGCAAVYSISSALEGVVWLAQNISGAPEVLFGSGTTWARISTHAIENEISKYPVIDDAIAFTYTQQGHTFYQLTFPTANKTWVADLAPLAEGAKALWHERSSLNASGGESRHRANCGAFAYGVNVVGDFENGALYAYDLDTYTDDGIPIKRVRGFPHLLNDGKRLYYQRFVADMDVGEAQGQDITDFDLSLRLSDTRGRTWSNPVTMSLGAAGAYNTQPQWRRLGHARDRVFELTWTCPFMTALNRAFIDVTPGAT